MKSLMLLAALPLIAAAQHRFQPLPPAESAKLIHLPPGYRAEVIASEPMIQEPVWAAWDGNGALYVAEMNSYMQDTKGTGTKTERNGRIKRLVDLDGDGVMDRATVFIDHLLLPRMILALDERILVQETDDTSFYAYRDTNGDGVADEKTQLFKGHPAAASVEHQDSALTWNIDNWLYTAHGGQRHRFTRGKWESERIAEEFNQWGMGMDDTGTLWHSMNHVPGRNFNQHWYYWNLIGERLKWKRFTRPSLGAETDEAFQLTYRAQPIGDRADVCEKSWTSACGLSIYRGDALPECRGDEFICEPCGHAVRRGVVTRESDGRLTLRNPHERAEFFMSEDFYCRPVSTHTGPDGCLYVVDMYRGMIQDAPWVSADFAERITAMGADAVKNRGRIYRIIASPSPSPSPSSSAAGKAKEKEMKKERESSPPRLLDAKPAQLVPHLAHANGWWRDTAQRLIILRGDKSVLPALLAMARTHANPLARLHALWTLEGLDALTPSLLAEKLRDDDYRLRAAAIRLHEKTLMGTSEVGTAVPSRPHGVNPPASRTLRTAGDSGPYLDLLAPLAKDADPGVRRQLVLSLGWSSDPKATQLIQQIASADPANPIITLAALTALYGREDLPLVKQVQDGSLFRGLADVETRTRAQALWKSGLESWKNVASKPRTRDKGELTLIEKGAQIYQELCLACHGPDGKGVTPPGAPVLAPTLVGSPRVLGPKEALVRILLHGLAGPIDGKDYQPSIMAPLGAAMPDVWTASVLTYVRQEWTNDASAIRVAEVAAIRNHARSTPWTLADLAQFSAPALTDRTGWVATANGHTPMNAIDGVIDASHQHAWHGVNTPQSWLAVDLGKPHRLTHLVMISTEPDWAPRGFKVEVSDDGQTWSAPVSTGTGTGTRTMASFEPLTTRHVRIWQTGNAIERWLVSELEIHGEP